MSTRARSGSPSKVAPAASSRATSSARSAARKDASHPSSRCRGWWPTRRAARHAAAPDRTRAPTDPARRVVGVDAGTAMAGSPRAAPRVRTCRASTSSASLRQLVVSVRTVPAAARLEVGVDVGAAEGVDRLLGVTDEHERRVAVEGAVEHAPLHRVGVLELVDQHDRPARRIRSRAGESSARSAPSPAGSAGRRSRGCRAVACAARSPRAPCRRSGPWPPPRWWDRPARGQGGLRVADRDPGEPEGGRSIDGRLSPAWPNSRR